MSEFWSNESLFNIRLCTIVLFERISSSLEIFLNGYEHIEVLLNPCKITQDQKSGILFRGSIHLTFKNVLGSDSKRPMERKQGKQYIIYK